MKNINILEPAKDFIKKWEGLKLKAYLDSGDVATIGYGSTFNLDGGAVKIGQEITEKLAEQMLGKNIMTIKHFIDDSKKVGINDNQMVALISLVYNIGMGNFRFSTMLKKINDSDFEGAANEFERWKWDNGKVINGLIRRRIAEKELFLS
jgi:lysozyme